MDFFKPGSTLKREDPKAHSYERNRARDAYKKQLEIFKIRFEHELANHPKLDFDAKQEIRIKAKGMRERCLATYRESLQGLATTSHRRNYKDLFLGNRDLAVQMHDTTILDYELRLTHEMDTIISNLNLMKEDKSNRETLDWMASLARQKFSYELFEMAEHPQEVDIKLQLEREHEEDQQEPVYPYEEELAGPICGSRLSPPRYKSSFMREMMKNGGPLGHTAEADDSYDFDGGPSAAAFDGFYDPAAAAPAASSSSAAAAGRPRHWQYSSTARDSRSTSRVPPERRGREAVPEEEQEDQLKDETFRREFNLITQSPRLVRSQYEPEVDEDEEMWRIRRGARRGRDSSPAASYISDYTDRDYVYRGPPPTDRYDPDSRCSSRSVSRQPPSKQSNGGFSDGAPRRREAAPVDVDDDDDVEAFLAKSRAMLNKAKNRPPVRFDYDDDDED